MLNKLHIAAILALAATALTAVSCGHNSAGGADEGDVVLSVYNTSVGSGESSQYIRVTAYSSWTIAVSADWVTLDKTAGNGSVNDIVMSWTENESESADRSCTLTLYCGSQTQQVTFTQSKSASVTTPVTPSDPGSGTNPVTLNPDKPGKWLELPATDSERLYFFTHDMALGGGRVRNYSFYLDPEAKISVWVAYPLNSGLIGTGNRSGAWGLDPKVPVAYQPVIFSAFGGGYERGHQLPSADRYTDNVSTFYGTNMTPQKGELNEHIWASLEGKVRGWSRQLDTLYVVTGADINGSTNYATDNYNKKVTVPTGYFKALVGYKKGGSVGNSTGGYIGIAFYFEHKGYTDSNEEIMKQSMTISALEKKTGYDFFANLPGKVGSDIAKTIETTTDSWWSNH